jgi:hypothetical protein
MILDKEIQNALQAIQSNFPEHIFHDLEKDCSFMFYHKHKKGRKYYVTYRRSVYLQDNYKGFDLVLQFLDNFIKINNRILINVKANNIYYGFTLTKDKRTGKYSRGMKDIIRFCKGRESIFFHFRLIGLEDIDKEFFMALKNFLYSSRGYINKTIFKQLDEIVKNANIEEIINFLESNLYVRVKAELMF